MNRLEKWFADRPPGSTTREKTVRIGISILGPAIYGPVLALYIWSIIKIIQEL